MYNRMIDDVVAKYGFEDARVIDFCELCGCAGQSGEAYDVVLGEYVVLMSDDIFSED